MHPSESNSYYCFLGFMFSDADDHSGSSSISSALDTAKGTGPRTHRRAHTHTPTPTPLLPLLPTQRRVLQGETRRPPKAQTPPASRLSLSLTVPVPSRLRQSPGRSPGPASIARGGRPPTSRPWCRAGGGSPADETGWRRAA